MPTDVERFRTLNRGPAALNLALGIWLFISPWVLGTAGKPDGLNAWIAGILLIVFASVRLLAPGGATAVTWYNMALGVWIFNSAFIFGTLSADASRFFDDMCVGVVVLVVAITGRYWATHPPSTQS